MIGLGRMGNGMTERLREHGHDVKTYDPNVEARTAASLEELKSQLDAPRAFWLMIPAGKITEDAFSSCSGSWTRATRSSTVATPTSATRSAVTARPAPRGSTSSAPACQAVYGA